MLDKLEFVRERYDAISEELLNPAVFDDMKIYKRLNKEYKDLEKIVVVYDAYKLLMTNIATNKQILNTEADPEFVAMAKEELATLEPQQDPIEQALKLLLVPQDPEDGKNAVVEVRGGAGGDEACLFAGDLYRMYMRYCELKGWKAELVDFNEGTAGGYKEVIFNVSGADVYGIMKYEAGVHRVQRVPNTETQGRVHTSAASVVVMPEADEFDVEIKDSDVRIDTFCSSGAGGQSVNTTYSAVRLTHMPTGVVVSCQDERSQLRNRDRAMGVLRSRVYEIEMQKRLDADATKRKSMVATGDRSAKIRTYNFPQSRVTDHRIGYTMYSLDSFMNGNINDMIDALQVADNAEKLKESMGT
jgi:peptide chain release factor 1